MTQQNDNLSVEPVNNSFWWETIHDNTSIAYASGKVVGTTHGLVVRGHSGGGIIRVINGIDRLAQSLPLRFWFFRRRPTIFANNADFVINENDEGKLAGWVDVSNMATVGGKTVFQNRTANVDFSCPDDFDHIGRIYYTIEARGSGTPSAAMRINMGDWPD